MSDCPNTRDVSTWLDGELPTEQSEFMRHHVEACPACSDEADSLRALSAMFSTLRADVPVTGAVDAGETVRMRILTVAALLFLGISALLALPVEVGEDELQFEAYLERSIDEDVLEVTTLPENGGSRDRIVGLLISSTH